MKEFATMGEQLFDLLIFLNRSVFNMNEITEHLNLNNSQMKVIFILHKHGKLTASEIGKIALVSKPNMTPLLDSLVERDLILREQDLKDRRKTFIELSDKGWELLKSFRGVSAMVLEKNIPNITKEDVELITKNSKEIMDTLAKYKKLKKDDSNTCDKK